MALPSLGGHEIREFLETDHIVICDTPIEQSVTLIEQSYSMQRSSVANYEAAC